MKESYWYNNHLSRKHTYVGYWCFLASALYKILDIDDYDKKCPYIPYDLI